MKKYLDQPKFNVLIIVLAIALGTIGMATGKRDGTGMAFLILFWVPAIIGILTIAAYLLSRIFIKKFNWLISLFGIAMALGFALSFFFGS